MTLTVDGWWGSNTIIALKERFFGEGWSGAVEGQYTPTILANTALSGSVWHHSYHPTGDSLIEELQKYLGVSADGIIGTDTIKALQHKMGTYADGILTGPSPCVAEMQRRLNAGTF